MNELSGAAMLQMALEDEFVGEFSLRLREYLTQAYQAYNAWKGTADTCPPFKPSRGSEDEFALLILVKKRLFLPVDNPDGVSLGTYKITHEGRKRALRFVEHDALKNAKTQNP